MHCALKNTTKSTSEADMTDDQHEARILACYERWREGNATWAELTALIEQRSPDQVARMEAERGLL